MFGNMSSDTQKPILASPFGRVSTPTGQTPRGSPFGPMSFESAQEDEVGRYTIWSSVNSAPVNRRIFGNGVLLQGEAVFCERNPSHVTDGLPPNVYSLPMLNRLLRTGDMTKYFGLARRTLATASDLKTDVDLTRLFMNRFSFVGFVNLVSPTDKQQGVIPLSVAQAGYMDNIKNCFLSCNAAEALSFVLIRVYPLDKQGYVQLIPIAESSQKKWKYKGFVELHGISQASYERSKARLKAVSAIAYIPVGKSMWNRSNSKLIASTSGQHAFKYVFGFDDYIAHASNVPLFTTRI